MSLDICHGTRAMSPHIYIMVQERAELLLLLFLLLLLPLLLFFFLLLLLPLLLLFLLLLLQLLLFLLCSRDGDQCISDMFAYVTLNHCTGCYIPTVSVVLAACVSVCFLFRTCM